MSSDDPYDILGVNRNATTSEIKSAYRKLALKFHPDKQKGNEEDRAKASAIFTKIGNAYEILSDNEARAKFDSGGFTASSPSPGNSSSSGSRRSSSRRTNNSPFDDPFFNSDPFSGFGGFGFGNNRQGGFSDPFEIFNRVFEEEFGVGGRGRSSFSNHRSSFDEDPFFSSPFGNRGSSSAFGMMDQMMSNMMHHSHNDILNNNMNIHHQSSSGMGGGQRRFSSSSFSSSSSSRGGGGVQESVSTRTVVVNGKRKSITERTTVKPDGTVEKQVEESCDDDFPSSNNQFLESDRHRRLSSARDLLPRRMSSRRSSRK